MSTPRTWIGGGNNRASNPKDWSPGGRPEQGDSLTMNAGTTINIRDNELAGNPLMYRAGDTMNLSHGAHVTAQSIFTSPSGIPNNAVFNITGRDTLDISSGTGPSATVNIAANSKWVGGFNIVQGTVTVNGAPGASFSNQTSSGSKLNAVINADVTGTGVITDDDFSRWEFTKSVGAGQTLNLTGLSGGVQIDHPEKFHAKVVDDGLPNSFSQANVDLLGLATADSYTYKNDLLRLYSGNHVIYKMSLSGAPGVTLTASSIGVEKTSTGVLVLMDRTSGSQSELLPLHCAQV